MPTDNRNDKREQKSGIQPQSRGEESNIRKENRNKDSVSKPDRKTGTLNSNN